MISLINTRQIIANQQIKAAFATKWYYSYHNSSENLDQFIDKFQKKILSVGKLKLYFDFSYSTLPCGPINVHLINFIIIRFDEIIILFYENAF